MPSTYSKSNTEGQGTKSEKVVKVDPQYVLSINSPVLELDVVQAFSNLTPKEKLYAHYLSLASWYGGLICFLQGSPEGTPIFILLMKVFSAQPMKVLQREVLESGVTEDDFKAILVFAAGVLTQWANYKSFGDSKFIPDASPEVFESVIKHSAAYKKEPAVMDALWQRVKNVMYSLSDMEKTLGFPDKGVTTYLSANITKSDTDLINKYLEHRSIEGYNTRAFKTISGGKSHYEIRLASEEEGELEGVTFPDEEFEGAVFRITRGDYAPLMGLLNKYLEKAKAYAANQTQTSMLEKYIESFKTGSLDAHKDASKFWIKDKTPVIESYIGFIETYRDPAGQRAEFSGWVALVNKNQSKNYISLVEAAESLLVKLPWAGPFEKDRFLRPDFTSLDVLTFANSSIPVGINIPNYDCIRQNEGFKNVSLGNVLTSNLKDDKFQFLSESDEKLLQEYRVKSFEVHVGLHELLGHGSGKLFKKEANGQFNFDIEKVINPLTGGKIEKWYEAAETYDGKFSTISSSYEECRAEAVGLYLSLLPEVMAIFGYSPEEADTLAYINWLSMMWGIVTRGPESYSTENKAWLQAHTQARFVLMRVLLEAGEDLLKIEETVPNEDLLVTLDRSKIYTVGKKAIGDFLLKLQVFKSTGDIEAAEKMYSAYSKVPEEGSPWRNWRRIALSYIKPRRMILQPNTSLTEDGVVLKRYDPSFVGVINSWVDRFPSESDVYEILQKLYEKDEHHFTKNV